ncbi:hypothetical protein BD408DRAFT_334570 [Parasitella parasitica]|nr:hypothetical protein BD408DRAFT_334570 [Parasitella parasitica]
MILVEDDDDEEDLYAPIFEWPAKCQPTAEPDFDSGLVGNEEECKLQFCRLVAQAYEQYTPGRPDCPKDMFLIFDEKDNVQGISFVLKDGGREDYLEFGGSLQYIAPELSVRSSFNYEPSDIWALGISLYRMLVGKFPFFANNGERGSTACGLSHRDLFRKMFTSDFILPKTLSSGMLCLQYDAAFNYSFSPFLFFFFF